MTTPDERVPPAETLGADSRGRGVIILAWFAIGFGVISLPGALGFIPALYESALYEMLLISSNTAPFTATLSWLLAVIATVISGIRLLRPPRTSNAKRAFALAAPGAVLGTVALVVVVIFIGNTLGLFQSNLAARPGEAAVDHYLEQDGTLICYTEDNGHFVNNTPWYSAFVEAPETLGTESAARKALERAGYPESRRTEISDYYDDQIGAFVVESLTVNPSEYEGDSESPQATLTVFPEGEVRVDCTPPGGEYGDAVSPADGRVLVHVQILLEPTR